MDLLKISFISFLVLSFGVSVLGQTDGEIRLVDEFDPRQGCESLERGLDQLFLEASEKPLSKAYVVVHQGKNVFDNELVYYKAINYAAFRKFPAEYYAVIPTSGTDEIKVSLWIGMNDKVPTNVKSEVADKLPGNISRTQISVDIVEIVTLDGRDTYISNDNPSCLYRFDPVIIRELLKANKEFEAELVIRTKTKHRFQKLTAIFRKEFSEIGISVQRLKFIYAGRDKEIEFGKNKLASVTTSFVRIRQRN